MNDIARKRQLPRLAQSDIDAIHGLPCKPDKAPIVLLRFASRLTRDAGFEERCQQRGVSSNAYFHEKRTARNKKLFWLAHQKTQKEDDEFEEHKNGNTFVRKKPSDRVLEIGNE